ncbi:MAG: hypothetical protein J6Y96_00010 [Mycoplasma sp.]|nr:hypothetical protein [Mycoplasma sp.]
MFAKINTNKIKILHSSIIEYCQKIEYDLKWFIGESCGTDIEDVIFLELESEKRTLGQIINLIEKSELMSKENLSFLKQMNEKRIYYCHKCFLKFYKYKTHHSQYKKLLNLLTKDLEKFKNLYKDINNLRYQNS